MKRHYLALLGLAACTAFQATSYGQNTFFWVNQAGGSYHTAANWSPSGGPPSTDSQFARFTLANTYTVNFNQNPSRTASFSIENGNVTFTKNPLAAVSHFWGETTNQQDNNFVSPAGAATSASLTITNFTQNSMTGDHLTISAPSGKSATFTLQNSSWTSEHSVVVTGPGNANLNILSSNGTLSYVSSPEIRLNGSGGTATVSGSNARMASTVLLVGHGTGGFLNVLNGGVVETSSLFMVSDDHSALTISGTGSILSTTSALIGTNTGQGQTNAQGTVNIENAGRFYVASNSPLTFADNHANSRGTLLLTGTGSLLVAGNSTLILGREGTATATISSGGQAEVKEFTLGFEAGSNGTLTITGANSALTTAANTQQGSFVGHNGNGVLNVSSNGLLTNQSYLVAGGFGDGGTGQVNITTGGKIITPSLVLGSGNNSMGSLLLDGNGSILNASGLTVGSSSGSLGTAIIANQAVANLSDLSVGSSSLNNIITIRSGAQVNIIDDTAIGQGRGTMLIESGGIVNSNGGVLAPTAFSNGNSNALVTVTGTGSRWNADATGSHALEVGQTGQATVLISNGGQVTAGNSTIGGLADSTGTVTLSGLGSTFAVTGNLSIAGTMSTPGGTGTLSIGTGTTASVGGNLTLWTNGTVNLNGGTLNVGSITFNDGNWNWTTGTVNFTQPTMLSNTLLTNLIGSAHVLGANKSLGSMSGIALTTSSGLTIDGGRLSSGATLDNLAGNVVTVQNGGVIIARNMITNNTGGSINISNMGLLQAEGGLTNFGSIVLSGIGAQVSGGTIDNRGSIRGTGVINNTLSNNTTGQVRVAAGDWLTFNDTGHANLGSVQLLGGVLEFASFLNTGTQGFISGHGTLLTSSGAQGGLGLVNTGTFAFSGGNTNIYGDVQNNTTGRIVTSGGSVTTFHDDVLHNGAEIRTSPGAYSVFFGSVSGASPYTGSGLVQFEGDLRPGNSPADVSFAGDVAFSVTSRLVTEIGGLLAGREHDRLTIQGQLDLGGLLDVPLINGFTPAAGDRFTIIDNLGQNRVNGTFLGLPEGSNFVSGGQLWSITYQGGTGNDVMLMAVPEPTTWAMIGLSTLGVAGYCGYRRRKSAQGHEQEIVSQDLA